MRGPRHFIALPALSACSVLINALSHALKRKQKPRTLCPPEETALLTALVFIIIFGVSTVTVSIALHHYRNINRPVDTLQRTDVNLQASRLLLILIATTTSAGIWISIAIWLCCSHHRKLKRLDTLQKGRKRDEENANEDQQELVDRNEPAFGVSWDDSFIPGSIDRAPQIYDPGRPPPRKKRATEVIQAEILEAMKVRKEVRKQVKASQRGTRGFRRPKKDEFWV